MTDPTERRTAADSLVRTISCRNPGEFLNALTPRFGPFRGTYPRQWIFRGLKDDSYPLVPTALREQSQALVGYSSRPVLTSKGQRFLEICALELFLKTADSIGLLLPEDSQLLRKYLREAKNELDFWPPDNVLSLMALAQHHGIPTRLLDWSRHPLKAALFAASGVPRIEPKDQTGLMSVWAFSLDVMDLCCATGKSEPPRQPPFVLVTAPTATNENLRAQEGVFSLAQGVSGDNSAVDRRPLDKVLSDWVTERNTTLKNCAWLYRITLPRSEADNLRWELAHEGITMAALCPNFRGVVAAMEDMDWLMRSKGPGGMELGTGPRRSDPPIKQQRQ